MKNFIKGCPELTLEIINIFTNKDINNYKKDVNLISNPIPSAPCIEDIKFEKKKFNIFKKKKKNIYPDLPPKYDEIFIQ